VDWYDFILFVHVLAAFAVIAALVIFWCMIVATMRTSQPSAILAYLRVARPATVLIIAGAVGTLIFGIWLAIYLDGYELWDGWILASLVLWAISNEVGRRGGQRYERAAELAGRLTAEGRDEPSPELTAIIRERPGLTMDIVSTIGFLVILMLMFFKPGGV
jgi:uncharacterized membrane protein